MILEPAFFAGAGAVIVDDKRREFATSIAPHHKVGQNDTSEVVC